MKGITYITLNSNYPNDVTKNGTLTNTELDKNFHVLRGLGIKEVFVENDKIKIKLLNDDIIESGEVFSKYTKDLSFSYDKENGRLTITRNGIPQVIEGFTTLNTNQQNVKVFTDGSIIGNGSINSPLSINPIHLGGYHRPINQIVDLTNGSMLPTTNLTKGLRVLTIENKIPFGLLYNYDAVKLIACQLKDQNSQWRIPTKEEWDSMLNAIELQNEDKTHGNSNQNRWLGRYAGKFLKSTKHWITNNNGNTPNNNPSTNITPINNNPFANINNSCVSTCNTTSNGVTTSNNFNTTPTTYYGVDKYGFNVLPSGYADDGKFTHYFQSRATFWTATNQNLKTAFVKRFDFDNDMVHQDLRPTDYYFSLRLIKDYNGSNFYGSENILGTNYSTILMPSSNGESKVWMSVNFSLNNEYLKALIPNNGQNLESVTTFYSNEWDGTKWHKVELNNGDAFSLISDTENAQYRIVNDRLEKLEDVVTESVKKNFEKVFDKITLKLTEIENECKLKHQDLTNEISRIDSDIYGLSQDLYQKISLLKQEITNLEIPSLREVVNQHTASINEIKYDLSLQLDSINEINVKLEKITDLTNNQETLKEGLKNANQAIDLLTERVNGLANKVNELLPLKETVEEHSTKLDELTTKVDTNTNNITSNTEKLTEYKQSFDENKELVKSDLDVLKNSVVTSFELNADGQLTITKANNETLIVDLSYNFGEI